MFTTLSYLLKAIKAPTEYHLIILIFIQKYFIVILPSSINAVYNFCDYLNRFNYFITHFFLL